MSVSLLALALTIAFPAAGASSYGGCSDLFVWRTDGTESSAKRAVYASIDREKLGLAKPKGNAKLGAKPATHELKIDGTVVRVAYEERGEGAAPFDYCSDIGAPGNPPRRWKATSGRVRLTIEGADAHHAGQYRVDVELFDVKLMPESGVKGAPAVIEHMTIPAVGVGWFPG